MEFKISLETYDKNYPALIKSSNRYGKVILSTISDFQESAEIKLFLSQGNKKELVKIISINKIPKQKAGIPKISVLSKHEANNIHLKILINGKFLRKETIDISDFISNEEHKTDIKPIIFFGIAALLFGFLTFLFITDNFSFRTGISNILENFKNNKKTSEERLTDIQQNEDSGSEPVLTSEEPVSIIPEIKEKQELSEIIYFPPDSSVIILTESEKLNKILQILKDNPEAVVRINGHCALKGFEGGRLNLSAERAEGVKNFFTSKGIELKQNIEAKGWGDSQPVTMDEDKQNLNRRVEIKIEY